MRELQPIAQVTQRATDVLIKELGVVDTIRFLNQFRVGSGNYTAERMELFQGLSVKDIAEQIKAQRNLAPERADRAVGRCRTLLDLAEDEP